MDNICQNANESSTVFCNGGTICGTLAMQRADGMDRTSEHLPMDLIQHAM